MSPASQHPAQRPGQHIDIGVGRTRDQPKDKDREQAGNVPQHDLERRKGPGGQTPTGAPEQPNGDND